MRHVGGLTSGKNRPPMLGRFGFKKHLLMLLCLSALLAASALAFPHKVSGDEIQVIRDHHEVDFPGAMAFNISAEAESPIVEIQLWHRRIGQDLWSNTNLEFAPGKRVAGELILDISGEAYFPPGAELEYYYVIRSDDGIVKQTDSKVVEYLDSKFNWERTQVGPLLLVHHDLVKPEISEVLQEVERALNRIIGMLPVTNVAPIKGVIYNSAAEARGALPSREQTVIEDEQVFGGFAFPADGVFVGLSFETTIIVHESAHLLLRQAVGSGGLPLTAWLDEGFANQEMPSTWKRFSGSAISSRGSPFSQMTKVPEQPAAIATFYEKSESLVAYLVKEFGSESFQQLITQLRGGRALEDALLEIHGFSISESEAQWSKDERWPPPPVLGKKSGQSAWRDILPVALGALVFLVLMIMVSSKRDTVANTGALLRANEFGVQTGASAIRTSAPKLGFVGLVFERAEDFGLPIPLLFAICTAILVIIGSLASWVEVRSEAYVGDQFRIVSANGTDADGYITLIGAAIAIFFVFVRLALRRPNLLLLGCTMISLLVSGVLAITSLLDLSASSGAFSSHNLPSAGESFVRIGVDVGWGLVVVSIASWTGISSIAYQYWHDYRL